MIPKSSKIVKRNGGVWWYGDSFEITVEEAESISKLVKSLVSDDSVTYFFVDNHKATGQWPSEVKETWSDLMAYLGGKVDKVVTICPNSVNKLSINFLARKSKTFDKNKAFLLNEVDQAADFLGVAIDLEKDMEENIPYQE